MIGDRYEIKKEDLALILAESWTYKYLELIADNKQKKQLADIREICIEAHANFGVPTSPEDSFQIQDYVYKKMQERLKDD